MTSHATENHYAEQVDEVRQRFATVFKENIQKSAYDKRDLGRLNEDDSYVCCFLKHQNGSLDKACDMIDVSLRWRKEIGVNDLTEQSFPQEIHEAGGVFYHGEDKDGHLILHIVVAKNRRDLFPSISVKRLLAWHIDKVFLKHPGQRIVVLIDMTSAGLANVDIDVIKFQVSCFTTYYPALLAYMLIFEMPWVLNAIWNIIKKLLNAEQQKSVLLVKKPQMTKYINQDQLFVHMGGSDDYKYKYIPTESSGVEVPLHESEFDSLSPLNEHPTQPAQLRKRVTFSGLTKSVSFDGIEGEEQLNITTPVSKTLNCIRDSSAHHGSLADISPSERLTFLIELNKGDLLSHIRITNTSQHKLSFKVKTTSPDVYRVKPHTGILTVNEQVVITVLLPSGHLCSDVKDKFLIMLLTIKDDVSLENSNLLNSLWKKASPDSEGYMEHRLICQKIRSNGIQQNTQNTDAAYKTVLSPAATLEDKVELLLTKQQEIAEQLKKLVFMLTIVFCLLFFIAFVMVLNYLSCGAV